MLSLYIHWPYCVSKCPYCDFNSRAGCPTDQKVWSQTYASELDHYAALTQGRTVQTIYFGGGTPSLMNPQTVESVLATIAKNWAMADDAEITLEANPSSSETEKFAAFRNAGINRLSLGIQSLNDPALNFLGRAHTADEARAALALAAKHFPRYSFDLIYGYAGHTLKTWKEELREALPMANGHISLYNLTIEQRTPFAKRTQQGETLTASEEESAAMYEATQDIAASANLPPYEISNYATPGEESRHNLAYWHYNDYIGIGPGAHGRLVYEKNRHAIENHPSPDTWLRQVKELGHGQKENAVLDKETAMREALLMGLRLQEGIDLNAWNQKFNVPLTEIFPSTRLERLKTEGLIELTKKALRATPEGLEKLNGILGYLLYS